MSELYVPAEIAESVKGQVKSHNITGHTVEDLADYISNLHLDYQSAPYDIANLFRDTANRKPVQLLADTLDTVSQEIGQPLINPVIRTYNEYHPNDGPHNLSNISGNKGSSVVRLALYGTGHFGLWAIPKEDDSHYTKPLQHIVPYDPFISVESRYAGLQHIRPVHETVMLVGQAASITEDTELRDMLNKPWETRHSDCRLEFAKPYVELVAQTIVQ